LWGAPRLILVGLVIWIGLGLFGLYSEAKYLPSYVQLRQGSPFAQRVADWSPIWGFGVACAPRLAPATSVVLVDPFDPNSPLGQQLISGANGQTNTVNLQDIGFLRYALYPRTLSGIGDLSAAANPTIQGDYAAVWVQAAGSAWAQKDSSPQALASAGEAMSSLSARYGNERICSYTDAGGDIGAVFAVSPRAQSALASAGGAGSFSASASPPVIARTGVAQYILVLAGLVSLWLIGFMLLLLLAGQSLSSGFLAALAFPMGATAVGAQMLLYSILGLSWSLVAILLPWLVCAVWLGARYRDVIQRTVSADVPDVRAVLLRAGLTRSEYVALVAIVLTAVGVSICVVRGLPEFDGLGLYYFKALAFFHDHGVTAYYSNAERLFSSIPAHPPLISLDVAFLYLVIGHIDEQATLLLWPAFFVVALAVFYLLVRSIMPRSVALWLTLVWVIIDYPLVYWTISGAYVDAPLAAILLCAAGLAWYVMRQRAISPRAYSVVGAMLAGAAFIKEEGLTASLVTLVALVALLAFTGPRGKRASGAARAQWWMPALFCVAPFLVGIAPWLAIRLTYPIPEMVVGAHSLSLAVLSKDLMVSAVGFIERTTLHWIAPLAALVIWLAMRYSQQISWREDVHRWRSIAPELLLVVVIVAQTGIDIVAMATNPIPPQFNLAFASTRLILQLSPLVFLLVAQPCYALWTMAFGAKDSATSTTGTRARQVVKRSSAAVSALRRQGFARLGR